MVVTDSCICSDCFLFFSCIFSLLSSSRFSILLFSLYGCSVCCEYANAYIQHNCIVAVNRQRHKLILCDENGSVGERASLGFGGGAAAVAAGGRCSTWNWKLQTATRGVDSRFRMRVCDKCALNRKRNSTIHNCESENRSGCWNADHTSTLSDAMNSSSNVIENSERRRQNERTMSNHMDSRRIAEPHTYCDQFQNRRNSVSFHALYIPCALEMKWIHCNGIPFFFVHFCPRRIQFIHRDEKLASSLCFESFFFGNCYFFYCISKATMHWQQIVSFSPFAAPSKGIHAFGNNGTWILLDFGFLMGFYFTAVNHIIFA